jgi:hypothetical protein
MVESIGGQTRVDLVPLFGKKPESVANECIEELVEAREEGVGISREDISRSL